MSQERELLEVDVLFVGGGVSALSGALRLSQLVMEQSAKPDGPRLKDLMIAVIDKGVRAGAHGISGAIMDPAPLRELVPDFLEKGAPLEAEVTKESFYILTKTGKFPSPIPLPPLNNHGNYVVSLTKLDHWLAERVEKAGVDVFWGFAGVEVLYDDGQVVGVRTGVKGVDASGHKKPHYEPGADIRARVTVFAEGSRGSLTKGLIEHLHLDEGRNPPAFEIGVKEVWQLPETRVQPGQIIHTMGYPLDWDTFGGGFVYGMKDNVVAVGHLTSLDYADPHIDPHRELQKFKLHPFITGLLQDAKLLQYGAKTIPVGGYFSIPKLTFPGGLIIGDAGNLFNGQTVKGVSMAMRSGMLAAETIFKGLLTGDLSEATLSAYPEALAKTREMKALRRARNFHQGMDRGAPLGLPTVIAAYLCGGRLLKERLGSRPDHTHMEKVTEGHGKGWRAARGSEIKYDRALTFDKEMGVYHSGTTHDHAQPCHLHIKDPQLCATTCAAAYDYPCVRFCPAGVYQVATDEATGAKSLTVSFENCLHCKTCDIKDPLENIEWTPPEGEGGPKYTEM